MNGFMLEKQTSGRYRLDGIEITCGDVIEIWVNRRWVRVSVEWAASEYYGMQVDTGSGFHLRDGLCARRPKD